MTKTIWIVFLVTALAGVAIAAGDAAAGKAAYDKACKSCHGADGTANAAIAKSMKVEMAHLGDAKVQALSDEDLKAIVTKGRGKMKPVKSVTGKAVDDVVAYMRSMKK